MSPIEVHWIATLTQALEAKGIQGAKVVVRSADAENWRFGVSVPGREFEIGFNHTDTFWARETTPGREKHLVSNDQRPINMSARAREVGVQLIAAAITDPAFPPRDPPVI